MRTWEFDLRTDRDLSGEADSDTLFEMFGGDLTPGVMNDTPVLACTVEGDDLATTIRDTLHRLTEVGMKVLHVQMEPEAVEA